MDSNDYDINYPVYPDICPPIKGDKGDPGPPGPQGPQGLEGVRGDRGPQGPPGFKGDQGCPGPVGPRGPQGLPGVQGQQGIRGDVGPQGDPGCIGPQGVKGNPGPIGPKGDRGPVGPKGDIGPPGPPGPTGETGPQGERGPIGPEGPLGMPGIMGLEGPQGPQGEKGCPGPQGEQGEPGQLGPQGEKGDIGLEGPQGIRGEKGDKGDTGQTGAIGPVGPAAATIPFSYGGTGSELTTYQNGDPETVRGIGFSDSEAWGGWHMAEGEWRSGVISVRGESDYFPPTFVMPRDALLKNIYMSFVNNYELFLEQGESLRPFVCLAVFDTTIRMFRILQDTIVYAEPYVGEQQKHMVKKGQLLDLDIEITAGELVTVMAGLTGENLQGEAWEQFIISGALYLE